MKKIDYLSTSFPRIKPIPVVTRPTPDTITSGEIAPLANAPINVPTPHRTEATPAHVVRLLFLIEYINITTLDRYN